MNKIFPGERWIYIVAAILALHMFCMPFTVLPQLTDKGPSWLGLDVSWQMTLNFANIKHLVWGKDILYTYGPLGFLATRNGWGVDKWLFILFDIIVVANFYLIFRDFIRDAADRFLAVFIIFLATLLLGIHYGSGLSWILTTFIFYWLYRSYREPALVHFIFAIFYVLIAFYVKLNAGLFGIVFLLGNMVNLLWHKKITIKKTLLVVLVLAGSLWLSAVFLKVEMAGYIKGAIELVKGYADVMYLDKEESTFEYGIDIVFYGIAIFYIIYCIYAIRRKLYYEVYYVGIALLFAVLLRKQSILRNDVQHLSEFYANGALLFLFGTLRDAVGKITRPWLAGIVIIVVALMVFLAPQKDTLFAFEYRYMKKKAYLEQVSSYKQSSFLSQKDKRYIPDSLLNLVGNSTVDIFPWDTEYLIENKLNYTPRPVFQSFTTYTDYLQQVNYKAYLGKTPEYIFYSYDAIDDRYAFNEEWIVNQFIAQNYTFVDTFRSNEQLIALLKKSEKTLPVTIKQVYKGTVSLNSDVNTREAYLIKMNVEYNSQGKWQAFWFRPPPIKIVFTAWDGREYEYKTSRELLKAGIMVQKRISTTQEYIRYIQLPRTLDQIIEIRLKVDPEYFKTEVPVEFYTIENN